MERDNANKPGNDRDCSEARCQTCWWFSDDFTAVCCNGSSEHRGNFVDKTFICPLYDADERRVGKQNGK